MYEADVEMEEVAVEEVAAEGEEDVTFFEDVAGDAVDYDAGAIQDETTIYVEDAGLVEGQEEVVADVYEEVAEVAAEEVVVEEAATEEVAIVAEEGAAMEDGDDEFFIDTSGGTDATTVAETQEVVGSEGVSIVEESEGLEAAVVEEVAAEEEPAAEAGEVEAEATLEEQVVETEVPAEEAVEATEEAVAAEEAVEITEDVVGEDDHPQIHLEVVEEAAAVEAAVEEVPVEGDVALVAEEAAAPAEAGGDDDDEFFLDTTGDADGAVAEEAVVEETAVVEEAVVEEAVVEEVVVDEAIVVEEDPPAAAEPEPEAEGDQLFGTAVAESFSFDLDDALEDPEPAAKKQKLENGLTLPIASRQQAMEDGSESPLADGFPDSLEEMEATPLPVASPAFKPPSAKWSGAPKRPSLATPVMNRSLPKVSPTGSRLPVMPSTPKAGFRPPIPVRTPFQPKSSFPKPIAPMSPYAGRGLANSAGPSQGGTSNATLSADSGFVFICSNQTANEVAAKRLFGGPDRDLPNMKQYIKPDTQLFVLNMDTFKMLGPFVPNSKPEYGIVKGAFGGRFNAQIRVLPTPGLQETQVEKKVPNGPKDAAGMKLMRHYFEKGLPAPINVMRMWGATEEAPVTIAPSSPMAHGSPHGGPRPPAIRPTPVQPKIGMAGKGMMRPVTPALGGKGFKGGAAMSPGGAEARVDKFVAGCDKEGRQYNLNLVVVNFCNVGASYAGRVLKKDSSRGDRLFDWEGVRKCVKMVTQELGLQVVGCIFENYWGPDRGGPQVPIPDDIRAMCNSIQETPSLTGKNHKSADDEMTIKCAYRRNCRFMDNDNYRDWLREMRDQRMRTWLQDSQEMLQMRYFFDTDLGSFDTLDGNIPVGLLAEGATQRKGSFGGR